MRFMSEKLVREVLQMGSSASLPSLIFFNGGACHAALSETVFSKNRQTWTVDQRSPVQFGRDRDAAFTQYHELMATRTGGAPQNWRPSPYHHRKYLISAAEYRSAGTRVVSRRLQISLTSITT